MRDRMLSCAVLVFAGFGSTPLTAQRKDLRFEVSVPASLRAEPVTGRMFVILTKDSAPEPREQAGSFDSSVPFFGLDVAQLAPGTAAVIDDQTLGFPVRRLREMPAGDYYIQAVLNVYSRFPRADGRVLWLHDDQWEGQHWNESPGNLVSGVQKVHLNPATGFTIRLALTRVLPPVAIPPDTKWVKHVRIQSRLLSTFWGRPIYLGAVVLLPKGYDEETSRSYPTIYVQDHFNLSPAFDFTTDSQPETPEERAGRLAATAREPGFEFARAWMSDSFPRMVAVTFQHPTPYYDDSYAINSPNCGPYGDALLTELIPYLESHFRLLREPRDRFLTGGSTGGWESLALQVYHPDFFGGVWSLYPDPVDFRAYQLSNVYADTSAFAIARNEWISSEVPTEREPTGMPVVSVRQESQLEAVLGSHGRSGEQFDAWEAVWGPVGPDGYPADLWDGLTGTMHHDVALWMKAHDYDLRDYLERNWSRIGPQLAGKIHVYVGDMDSFYLNLAVYYLEDFLEHRTNPYYAGSVTYGRPKKPHGWQPMTDAELVRMMAATLAQR